MAYIIESDDPQDIIAFLFPPRQHDSHVRLRKHWQIAEHSKALWPTIESNLQQTMKAFRERT